MSGYRCVNYYELCRLCTASQGTKKVHIFSEEAKKTNLLEKILGCLPIVVSVRDDDACATVDRSVRHLDLRYFRFADTRK